MECRLKRGYGLIFLFLAAALFTGAGHKMADIHVNDELQPATGVVLSGFTGRQLDAAYSNRLLVQDQEKLIAPFRNRTETSCWQSEFWGKYVTSALLAYRYKPTPELKKLLDHSVRALIATQTADGYIGNYAPDSRLKQWDIWGRKYCMLGLEGYYDLTGDRTSLEAAGRVADNLIAELKEHHKAIVTMGNHRGMAASSVLEPITGLYVRTGNKRYLDFAEEIVREWETDSGPRLLSKAGVPVGNRFPRPVHSWYGWEQGQKAYEMMSCYEGLLELYRVTGNEKYKQAVESTWQSIQDTELNAAGSGSGMECWFGGKAYQTLPVNHYQETCVTATWIKLSQQLLRLTGESKYADAVENSWYNALLGAMYADGSDWAKYSPLSGQRLPGEQQCGMGINCCEASGPRGLFTLPLTAVMRSRSGIQVNFYLPGKYTVAIEGMQAALNMVTDYPVSGKVTMIMSLPRETLFTLGMRIPSWSSRSAIMINGQPVTVSSAGSICMMNRSWKNNDTVILDLDMRTRVIHAGDHKEFFAFARGPLLLARDRRLGGPDTDAALVPVLTPGGEADAVQTVGQNGPYWVRLSARVITESHAEGGPKSVMVPLCDYASAGKTFSDESRFRVWIPQLVDVALLP